MSFYLSLFVLYFFDLLFACLLQNFRELASCQGDVENAARDSVSLPGAVLDKD